MTIPELARGGNTPGNGPLRDGGTGAGLPMGPKDLPSTLSKAAASQVEEAEIARDLWAGPKRVQEQGVKYLPKAVGEGDNYGTRLQRAVFFNMFSAALEGLVGFIFRKDPVLGDDVPSEIVADWENLDNAGTHGDVFVRQQTTDAMCVGHAAILVDFPDTGGTQTRGAERGSTQGAIRPYWVPIRKEDILSWREAIIDGQTVLTQVVLKRCRMVPDGAYGEKEETTYHVLLRDENGVIRWRVEMVNDQKRVVVLSEGVYANQIEIPIAEVSTSSRTALFTSRPTLADVMYLNLAHYRQWSDYDTSLHKTCVPIFTIAGGGEATGPLVLGPNTSFNFSNPAAKASYVSHDGAALAECRAALTDLVRAIADLSLSMLASDKRAAETAKAKEIDKSATDSKLAVTARGVQDCIERCLGFHARFRGLDSGGSITINREFTDQTMDPQLLTAYVGAIEKAGLPVRILTQAMQGGGLIDEDVNLDELDAEIAANAAAKEAQAQMDRQAQIDAAQASQQTTQQPLAA